MRILKYILPALPLILLLCGCGQRSKVCPPGSVTYFDSTQPLPAGENAGTLPSTPTTVKIGMKNVKVDQVVEGPLCNGAWKGVIYVACNVQVAAWTDQPLFLKDCNLTVEPDTVVYVAAHNNQAYYKGCSCHITGTETK